MGSLSFAEIVTILLVVLVIFGPNRLPEFARKLGELMAQARRATSQFSKDISSEWGDAVEPMMAVKQDFDGVKQDLKDATAAITGLGAAETKDHSPETTDPEPADNDETKVPLSSGTGESASQGDEGRASDRSGTGESASQTDVGDVDVPAGAEEAAENDGDGTTGQGADTELGEA